MNTEINMDPIHLNNEELDYEPIIRGKMHELDSNNRSKTRVLSELLRAEKQGALPRTGIGSSPFTPEQDIEMSQQICNELQQIMNKGTVELHEKHLVCSRAIHVGDRLQRVNIMNASAELVERYSDSLETMRTMYAQLPPLAPINTARPSNNRSNVSFATEQTAAVSTETSSVSNEQLQGLLEDVAIVNRGVPSGGAISRTTVTKEAQPNINLRIPAMHIPDSVVAQLRQDSSSVEFHSSGATMSNVYDESENAQENQNHTPLGRAMVQAQSRFNPRSNNTEAAADNVHRFSMASSVSTIRPDGQVGSERFASANVTNANRASESFANMNLGNGSSMMGAQSRAIMNEMANAASQSNMFPPLPIRSNAMPFERSETVNPAVQNTLNEFTLNRYNRANDTMDSFVTDYRDVSNNRALTDRLIAQLLQQNQNRAGIHHENIYNIRNQTYAVQQQQQPLTTPAAMNQATVPDSYRFHSVPLESNIRAAPVYAPVMPVPNAPVMPPLPAGPMIPIIPFAAVAPTENPVSNRTAVPYASAASNNVQPFGWVIPASNAMQMPMPAPTAIPHMPSANAYRAHNNMPMQFNQANTQYGAQFNVSQRANVERDDSRIPIHHWKTYFSGDEAKTMKNEMNIHDFLSQVDVYRMGENMSEAQLLRKIPHLLIGSARTWFTLHRHRMLTWNDFVDQLKQRFLSTNYNYQLYSEVQSRHQGKNEPIGSYIADMQSKFRAMSNPPDENHRLYLVRNNMLYEHAMALATQPVNTIEQLEMLVKQRESAKVVK